MMDRKREQGRRPERFEPRSRPHRHELSGSYADHYNRLSRYDRDQDYARRISPDFRTQEERRLWPLDHYARDQGYGWHELGAESYSDYGFDAGDWQAGQVEDFGYAGEALPGRRGSGRYFDEYGYSRTAGREYPLDTGYTGDFEDDVEDWGGYGRRGGYNRERSYGYPGEGRMDYSPERSVRDMGYNPRGMEFPGGVQGEPAFSTGDNWRMPGPYAGRGPASYQRSNQRILEDVCERLTRHGRVDASDIEVVVENGEVFLRGEVPDRRMKRMAEDTAGSVSGVRDVHNELRIRRQAHEQNRPQSPQSSQTDEQQ